MSKRWVCVALLALAAWLAGCATNPVTGQREISLVSSEQEVSMGKEGYKAVIDEFGAYDDQALATYVDGIGQRLAKVSHQPGLEWHFTLLDDPVVNAFAMPGGYIYITRGILAHLNSEAQLAGVLGHEIGHVTARHSAQQITKSQLAGLGLGVAGIFSESFRRYSPLAEQALGLMFLKYSRDNENQADQLGVDYSTKAGFDAREMPKTYVMLKRVGEASGQRLPSFLSTHPDPGDRETRTTQLANQAVAGKTGLTVNAQSYVERLDGLVFGPDPRQGYFEGERYYHPTMRFQMAVPAGWRTQNSRAAVIAAEPNQQAVMQLSMADPKGLAPAEFVNELVRRGSVAGADGRRETIGGWDAWVGRLQVNAQDGTRAVYAAAFVSRGAGEMFQVLGRSQQVGDANEERILAAARSLRPLTDPARLAAQPNRVRVQGSPATGEFQVVVPRLGPQALGLEPTSIMNNRALDERVNAGEPLKIIIGTTR